jgi:hypothetical protein
MNEWKGTTALVIGIGLFSILVLISVRCLHFFFLVPSFVPLIAVIAFPQINPSKYAQLKDNDGCCCCSQGKKLWYFHKTWVEAKRDAAPKFPTNLFFRFLLVLGEYSDK